MRPIKFKGKDIMDDHWVYGDLETRPAYGLAIIHQYNEMGVYDRQYKVDKGTVGQFTGMFDEDGHEIYEGDIIKIVEEYDDENVYTRIGVVCFEEGMYELQDKNGKHFAYLGWLMHDDSISKLEVIGNIHDNPELLT